MNDIENKEEAYGTITRETNGLASQCYDMCVFMLSLFEFFVIKIFCPVPVLNQCLDSEYRAGYQPAKQSVNACPLYIKQQ